jgi:hypothetical protein
MCNLVATDASLNPFHTNSLPLIIPVPRQISCLRLFIREPRHHRPLQVTIVRLNIATNMYQLGLPVINPCTAKDAIRSTSKVVVPNFNALEILAFMVTVRTVHHCLPPSHIAGCLFTLIMRTTASGVPVLTHLHALSVLRNLLPLAVTELHRPTPCACIITTNPKSILDSIPLKKPAKHPMMKEEMVGNT